MPSILVADPDKRFLASLSRSGGASGVGCLPCADSLDAQFALADTTREIAAVLVNPAIDGPHGIGVVRCALKHRPFAPVFYLVDGEPPFAAADLKAMGIRGTIPKPATWETILSALGPFERTSRAGAPGGTDAAQGLGSEASGALRDAESAGESEVHGTEGEFVAVKASAAAHWLRSLFDVYIRLSSGRYLKIVRAGDEFPKERLENYVSRGVTHFHFRKESRESLLRFCEQMTESVLSGDAPEEEKAEHCMKLGDEVTGFLKSNGVNERSIAAAARFVKGVDQVVSRLDLESDEGLARFIQDAAAHEHGSATTLVAGLVTHKLGLESGRLAETVGLAAFLHDVGLQNCGLYEISEALRSEEIAAMNEEERAIFRSHPKLSAELLRPVRGVDPLVVTACLQHHERINRAGFPQGLGLGQIGLAAEIVGISDELVRAVARAVRAGGTGMPEAVREMERTVYDSFSGPIVEAFFELFVSGRIV